MIDNGTRVLALLLVAASQAHADDYLSPTNERVRLSLGFIHVSSATDFRFDTTQGLPGTPIVAENVLGLNKSGFEPKFQAMVRAGERNRIRFDYLTLDRTGQATLAGPLVIRDVRFEFSDPVQTHLSLRTLGFTYEYSFVHRERFELAATISINQTDVSARARVSTAARHVDQRQDQAGPLPTVGLDSTYVLSKRFYLDARAQYFKAGINHLNGTLGFYEIAALYRLRPNVSFALGYNEVKATLVSQQPRNSGYFDFSSKGPEFFVRVAF